MVRKIFNFQNDLLVLFGIYYAIRFIYTKEIYIQIHEYTVNTLNLLILTIAFVTINRARDKKTNEETNQ